MNPPVNTHRGTPDLRPLSVCATAQQAPRAQRAGRYLPETTSHPARMQPALASHLITALTEPGQLVADPMCGAGTTLVEALRAGRHAVGVELEPRWASLARDNITHTARHGVAGHGHVITADARRLPNALPPQYAEAMTGQVSLVLTSPPYGLHTHGIASANPGSGVSKRNYRYTPTARTANLAYQPLHLLLGGLTRILAGCIPMLAPGGHVVLTIRPWRSHGELVDFPGLVTQAALAAGLVPVQRCVGLLAGLRDGQLVTRASFFQRRAVTSARTAGQPWHLIVHEDILIFRASSNPSGSAFLKGFQREPEGVLGASSHVDPWVLGEDAGLAATRKAVA